MDVADSDAINARSYVADMKNCEERLKTFEDWPRYMRPTPEQLARAGFYYTGIGDKVICFNCKVILKNWKPSDDAWREHVKWHPTCAYVNMAYCKAKKPTALYSGNCELAQPENNMCDTY